MPYKTRLELRRALVRCYDYFKREIAAKASRREYVQLDLFDMERVCFEALDRPSAADLKSLREGAGGGRA